MSEIFYDKHGNSCITVDCGELSSAWWIDPRFVTQCVEACVGSTPDGKKNSKWHNTINVVIIRAGQHGDNHYKHEEKNSLIRHLVFIMKTKKMYEH